MGIVTTSIISFALVALNFGFKPGFYSVWFRSWLVSYPLAVAIILFLGPWVQVLTNFLFKKTTIARKKKETPNL
jgi:hypothetical protein